MWLDKLKAMKADSGMTTREIAEKSGIPEPTLEKLFAGATKEPKLGTITTLVHFFGRTLDDLDDSQKTKKEPAPESGNELDEKLVQRLMSLTPEELVKVDAFVQGILASR